MILYDAWSSDKVALLLLNASLVQCQSGKKNRFYIEKNPIFSYSYDALAMRWGAFLCVEPGNIIFIYYYIYYYKLVFCIKAYVTLKN